MKVIKPVGRPEFFPVVLAFLLATSCGGRVYLVSSLGPAQAIVVDGNMDDWSGALSYVAKDHLFVGFVNDRDDLFICMTKETSEGRGPGRMGGWTIWIDPAGGSRKTMGIRIVPPGGPPEERPSGEGPERRPVEKPAEGEQGGQPLTTDRGADLEILGPGGNVLRKLSMEAAAKEGLEVGSGFSGGSFVLEVKIPLEVSEGHPIAVGAGPGGVIGIGFLSSRADRKDRRAGQPGGEMGGGGVPGARGVGAMGGPSGMRGAMPPNMNPDISKDIKVWTRVRLNQSDRPGRSTVLGLITE
ncbi:MAG: hypothetical protein WCC00_11605 [Candidatus Aminicenantales bacterium]